MKSFLIYKSDRISELRLFCPAPINCPICQLQRNLENRLYLVMSQSSMERVLLDGKNAFYIGKAIVSEVPVGCCMVRQ